MFGAHYTIISTKREEEKKPNRPTNIVVDNEIQLKSLEK